MSYDLSGDIINKSIHDNKEAEKNNLLIKDFGGFFNIKYNKEKLNGNNIKTLGLYRSLIVDNNGHIVCYSPPKSLEYEYFNKDIVNCYIEEFVEGTMVNIFFNTIIDDWDLTTRTTLGAKSKFNMESNKTFRYMFLSAMNHMNIEFTDFDKNFCYSFVLQHPENKLVIPIKNPKIILVDIFKCNKFQVFPISRKMFHTQIHLFIKNKNIIKPIVFTEYQMDSSLTVVLQKMIQNKDYTIMGYYVHNNNFERTKIRNPNYEHVRHLKGNSPKIQYQYYNLRQLNKVKDYLKYFPEMKKDFALLRNDLHKYTTNLYRNYSNCYINKVKPLREYQYEYKTHMFHLHNIYLDELKNDGKYVNFNVVKNYINNMEPARLMHVINFPLKRKLYEEQKIDVVNNLTN
jgi:hypothetical protein